MAIRRNLTVLGFLLTILVPLKIPLALVRNKYVDLRNAISLLNDGINEIKKINKNSQAKRFIFY